MRYLPAVFFVLIAMLMLASPGAMAYTFLLRADGIRIIEALDFSLYSDMSGVPEGALDGVADLSAVPVPPAVWLFGSGLIGLLGVARRRS